MDSTNPATAGAAPAAPARVKQLRDALGRIYEPAVSPRLKVLLVFIFFSVALLGASGVYLVAIRLLEWYRAHTYTNQFTLWMFLVHVVMGVLFVAPFLVFGLAHYASARHRKNRLAVRLGVALFLSGILVSVSGLALIQLAGLPQLPTGTVTRWVVYFLHALAPIAAVALYVLHRRAGPDINWRWGGAWGAAVGVFVVVMVLMHSYDPRQWGARGSPEGKKYFEPSLVSTPQGNFIPESTLMMDKYCMKCHQDIFNGWFHSAHHFSSFNNPPYLFSVRETRKVSMERDGNMRAARWCAGCHDAVPFLAGKFDDPNYDDVNDPTAHAGITCTVCHAMTNVNSTVGNGDYTIEEPLHYPFASSDNALLQWLNNQVVKAKPDFHKKTFLKDFHKKADFCSVCHKVSIPMALNHYKEFLRGQNHHDTFTLSGVSGGGSRSFYYPPKAKTNCAECHMPLQPSDDFGSKDFDDSGQRKIHNHLFPGANTGLPWLLSLDPARKDYAEGLRKAALAHADFLRGTDPEGTDKKVRIDIFGLKPGGTIDDTLLKLRPELPALKRGQTYLVEVVIRTLGVGHPFTQGTADSNEIWVDVTARSGGKVIGRNGALDGGDKGTVDEWAHFVNILMLDRDGHRIDRRNPQDIFTPLYDHQIPPGAAQVVHYALKVPAYVTGPVELEVKLRYRKFDFHYMSLVHGGDDKVPTLPITDLCEDRVTLPVEGATGQVAAQTSPIKPAWQRWNDYGIGCLLEGGADAKKGEFRQAEEAFKVLRDGPDQDAKAHAYLNLARIYNEDGRLDEAVKALNAAQRAEPPAPWWTVAWFNGLVNAENGHLEKAVTNFEQILDPAKQPFDRKFDFTRDYFVINRLGKTLFDLGISAHDDPAERDRYFKRAAEQYERTLTLDSEDINAHYGLTQCYSRLGGRVAVMEPGFKKAKADPPTLLELGNLLANVQQSLEHRLQAADRLSQLVPEYGKQPTDPVQPKLPTLQTLRGLCLPIYRQQSDPELVAAAAQVLGEVHRRIHAIYKLDDNAKDRTVDLYRKSHLAAGNAAQPIWIYPLNRPGAPGLDP